MRRLLMMSALLGVSVQVAALEDQFGKPVDVPGERRTIFFAADMEGSVLVREAFASAKTDVMAAAGVLYVADISAMPALIAKMFAKPKMRKMPYRIALDTEGQLTADWPRQEGAVTVINGEGHRFCTDVDCLKAALLSAESVN